MKLIECYVENFGKLKDKKYSFSDGLNCITGDNGSGKTTLAVFLKTMLYGMTDTKKTNLIENERKHYLPWGGGNAAGSLTFSVKGRTYRVERSFGQKASDDSFVLYDTQLGKISSDYSASLGEELFGIDADGFERTVFLSERALTPKSDNKSISAKLSDLVGCDGDIGEMDQAMRALDERRKFYYKKGGAGELSTIKERILGTRARLDAIEAKEVQLNECENRLRELKIKLGELSERSKQLSKESENAAVSEARLNNSKRIAEMESNLISSVKDKDALLAFFNGDPPSFEEINDANLKYAEAKKNMNRSSESEPSKEFRELSSFFEGKISEDDAEKLRTAIYGAKAKRDSAKRIDREALEGLFDKRIPSHTEVDEVILSSASAPQKGAENKSKIIAAAGAILTSASICLAFLFDFAFLLILLPSIALFIFAILSALGGKKKAEKLRQNKIDAFLLSVSTVPVSETEDKTARLYKMKSLIDQANQLEAYKAEGEDEKFIKDFLSRFSGYDPNTDPIIEAEMILDRYGHFLALKNAELIRQRTLADEKERAEALLREADAFLKRFPTSLIDPFTEIREKLNEYTRLSADIINRQKELSEIKALHEAKDTGDFKQVRSIEDIRRDKSATDESITACERDYAITERSVRELSDEIDAKDELLMKLEEQEELLTRQNENYNVILKTKEFLESAKDSMTAKYLGKTKAGFIKYTETISGNSDGEYEMSTDFGVSKIDGGASKSTEAYSRGTQDLFNLAARLALIDSLYENEEPFIILDDPFVSFDDGKINSGLKLLSSLKEERQIIYFTCSKTRAV